MYKKEFYTLDPYNVSSLSFRQKICFNVKKILYFRFPAYSEPIRLFVRRSPHHLKDFMLDDYSIYGDFEIFTKKLLISTNRIENVSITFDKRQELNRTYMSRIRKLGRIFASKNVKNLKVVIPKTLLESDFDPTEILGVLAHAMLRSLYSNL